MNYKRLNALLLCAMTGLLVVGCASTSEETEKEVAKKVEESKPSIPTKIMDDLALTPMPSKVKLAWSYEGETGPAFWGVMDPAYATCSQGKQQSPVDLKFRKPMKGHDLKLDYKATAIKVSDIGHTYQVEFSQDNKLTIGKKNYELKHMHIRSSSEHTLSGNELPLELQLFHEDDKGKTIVVSVIVIEGKINPFIELMLPMLPESGLQAAANLQNAQVDPAQLIPSKLTHYNYMGSLTYPPCTEGIEWNVLNTPITASSDQILALRKYYSNNKRTTQPLNGRKVKNY